MRHYQSDFLSFRVQVINRLHDGFCHRSHGHYNVLGIGVTIITERMVFPACHLLDLIHVLFDDIINRIIKPVNRLFCLEKNVRVLSSSPCDRMFRIQGRIPEFLQRFIINQLRKIFIGKSIYLLHFMRGPESIKKMKKGDPGLDGTEVCNPGKVHNLLNAATGKQGKPRLTGGIHVTMISKNGKSMGCHTSCTHVKNTRQKFSRNFIHVRDHEQQTL